MKVTATIITKQVATFDIGDLPLNLVSDLLTKNDGTFDGNWALGDLRSSDEKYTTESVEVVQAGGK